MADSSQSAYNQKNEELIKAFEDLIKKAKSLVKLNDSDVGSAAGADSLDEIAVGDADAVRTALQVNGDIHYKSLPDSDLNKVLASGKYQVAYGDDAKNTPSRFTAGVLNVEYSGGQYVQIMISRGEALVSIRGSSNGTSWSRWKDFLLGGVSSTTNNDPFWGSQRTSLNEYNTNAASDPSPIWKNIPFNWAQMIALGRSDNRAAYLAATSLGSSPRLAVGILNTDVVGDGTGSEVPSNAYVWGEAWHTKNTTVDSNGQIKKASPIYRLANIAADAATDGFEVSGSGTCNTEARGVTATHDDTGVYTVSGSLGFATEGWTITLPQDPNTAQTMVMVETEQADDGTITVRVYSRKFDINTASIVAGDPMDIPDGRWIDLRLSMPEPEPVDEDETDDDSTEELTA